MQTEATKKLFTIDDYYRIAETGVFAPDDRVELIEGEILEMSPIGPRHAACVNRLTRAFRPIDDRAVLSVQNPTHLNLYNAPQPDLLVLKPREDFYAGGHPVPEDVLLAVEVSETTLRYDQRVKVPLYARTGIREVWVVDVTADRLYVYRDARDGAYQAVSTLGRGESVAPVAFPDFVLKVDSILA